MTSRTEERKTRSHNGGAQGQGKSNGGALAPVRHGRMAQLGGFDPFFRLRDEFNDLFDQLLPAGLSRIWEGGRREGWRLDMQEDDASVTIRAEAPGFEHSDFDIQVRDNQLVLSATRAAESEEKERGLREWRQQELYRCVTLPTAVDMGKAEAEYRNGILTVTLPKTEESKAHHIPIKG